jgi:fructose-specific phosphotransferase system IIC component
MGRISDLTMRNADEFLTLTGFVGGFGLATATVGLWGGLAAGLFAGLFTLLVSSIDAVDPSLGPHH